MIPAAPAIPAGYVQGMAVSGHGWLMIAFVSLALTCLAYILGHRSGSRGRALAMLVVAVMSLGWAPYALAQATHGINWTWPAVTTDTNGNTITVDGYNIYCSTSQAGPFTAKTNSSLIAALSFLETGLTLGTTNFCQVTAVKGSAEGAHSPTSAGVLFQFPPAAASAPSGSVQ